MALNEFELIKGYFSDIHNDDAGSDDSLIILGVGDDAAITHIPDNHECVFSIDTQIEGVHFPADADPAEIAQRAFRSAVSDLAAMGASPQCFTLALTLPNTDVFWLESFSSGLKKVATEFNCALVGGDTTKGNLSITLQVQGVSPKGTSIKRDGAQVGDVVFCSGFLGGAAAYVQLLQEKKSDGKLGEKSRSHAEELFRQDYFYPTPCVMLGKAIRQYAHSAIDVSDGLLADLNHICKASQVSASIELDKLPARPELAQTFDKQQALTFMLGGGDDYQLCFTVAENNARNVLKLGEDMECTLTVIGKITEAADTKNSIVTCYDEAGNAFDLNSLHSLGYTHF